MYARMLTGALLLLAGAVADARPMVTACHGCTDTEARRMAQAQVPLRLRETRQDVYVVDTPNQRLRRYTVEVRLVGGFPYAMAWPEAPDRTWSREFEILAGDWHQAAGLLKSGIDLPPGAPVDSVTEVFYSAASEEAVSAALNRNLTAFANGVLGSVLKLLPEMVWSADIYVTVHFADGTSGRFRLTDLEPTDSELHIFKFRYVDGSARDSEGNAIPDDLESFYGFSANYEDAYNQSLFERQAYLYRVRLAIAPSTQKTTVVCVRTQDEVVCWKRRQR
ncbi:MAG: hypothetical protein P8080_07745 [Gammaproteobacteria bacterium]